MSDLYQVIGNGIIHPTKYLYAVDVGDGQPLEFVKQSGTYSNQSYYRMTHGIVSPPGKNDFPVDLYLFWAGGPDPPGSSGLWGVSDVLGSLVGGTSYAWAFYVGSPEYPGDIYLPLAGPIGSYSLLIGDAANPLEITDIQPW